MSAIRNPSYKELGASVGALVEDKQRAYGDSFGKSGAALKVLYPEGIPTEKLDDALTIVRILDKLFRIASQPAGEDLMGESPWQDIAGYALLALKRANSKKESDK